MGQNNHIDCIWIDNWNVIHSPACLGKTSYEQLESELEALRGELSLIHEVLDETATQYPPEVFTETGETLDGRAGTFARHLIETVKRKIKERGD